MLTMWNRKQIIHDVFPSQDGRNNNGFHYKAREEKTPQFVVALVTLWCAILGTKKKLAVSGALCMLCGLMSIANACHANERILVAAAADLKFAMDEISAAFKKGNPAIDMDISYGSSGNFYAQIKQGAPFDLFFSADASYPARLEEEGFAVKGYRKPYAIGKIVLWILKKSPLNPQNGFGVVSGNGVRKFAIANPKHAPYGRAAEEALRYYGVLEKIQGKLVFGENVSQTAQFIQTGAADAGVIALSLAVSPALAHDGSYWIIPDESYGKLEQVCAVLQRGKDKPGVHAFWKFVQGEKGKAILSGYGFTLP